MTTRALDVTTILSALEALDHELPIARWISQNSAQRQLFSWLETYQEQLAQITGLEVKASQFFEELNAFLANRGFSLRIAPFNPKKELGLVSLLDKLVRWHNGSGTLCDIATPRGALAGFELSADGITIYEVEGYRGSFLLELLTQSDETLWLFLQKDTSVKGLDLVKLSLDVMQRPRKVPMSSAPWKEEAPASARSSLIPFLVKRPLHVLRRSRTTSPSEDPEEEMYPTFAGATVPLIDFDLTPDLAWLLGAVLITKHGDLLRFAHIEVRFVFSRVSFS